ncbi:MAG TPA: RNA polymerase sigma factor [Salinivirgaceae bacterium]|nr:RNA polymerase sigma factor [Salinivirgaceae bacterium]
MTVEEYNQCVDAHADSLYRFILKNLRDREYSHDIVQDSFEKLWVNRNNVDGTKAKSYLFTTAYHTMIDHLRKTKRLDNREEIPPQAITHSKTYSDLQEILHEAIQRLPETQRMVLMLRDYEGYSYQEIGEITGLNESQVKVYIYRARIFLKDFIGTPENVI